MTATRHRLRRVNHGRRTPILVDDATPRHPGAAVYRGATVLPTGQVLHVRPEHLDGRARLAARSGESDGGLEDLDEFGGLTATGRTRRVLGRRLPVLTGYTGGPIPTHVEGSVRVGLNWPAVRWLLAPWSGVVAVLLWALATDRRPLAWACLAVFVLVAVVGGGRAGHLTLNPGRGGRR